MTYFDNAATTYPKPLSVVRMMSMAMLEFGSNPGRGGHEMSYLTSEKVYETRKNIATLFGVKDTAKVIFTKNCTESLNIVLKGLSRGGGHFICSSLDHNAVVRPLEALKNSGICKYDAATVGITDDETVASFKKLIKHDTKAIVCTGASNVFGKVLPIKRLAALAHEYKILFILDAAQTAGTLPIDCEKTGIDFLCSAGHKGLYGPMGTGILVINCDKKLDTIIEGGTGSFSVVLSQPESYPDRFESGTLNVPGIAALNEGVKFVMGFGQNEIYNREMSHIYSIYDSLKKMPGVILYTEPMSKNERFVPLLSFNIKGLHSEQTAELLAKDNIAVRAGLHCAPLAHETYNTLDTGTVRIAPSIFTKNQDVNLLLTSILKIAKSV